LSYTYAPLLFLIYGPLYAVPIIGVMVGALMAVQGIRLLGDSDDNRMASVDAYNADLRWGRLTPPAARALPDR